MTIRTYATRIVLFLLAAVVVIGLIGCGSNDNKEEGKETKQSTKEEENTTSDDVTVETKFGEVEITGTPERVVALGWGDAETVLSLGVEPVGASDWLAFGEDGVGPWLEGAYTKNPEIIGTLELDYEQIAALQPDLILDVKSIGDEDRYKRLSEIAPTVGVPEDGDNYLTSTEDQVRMIAKALGKVEEGENLLQDVDDAFEEAANENPHFADQTIVVAAYDSNGFGAYVEGDARVDFVTNLGFTNKEEVEALSNDNFYISVSDEQLELLDADLTVVLPIWIDPQEILDNELFQKIPSVEDGRSIILDEDMSNAFSTGTVPALMWTIEQFPDELNKVLHKE